MRRFFFYLLLISSLGSCSENKSDDSPQPSGTPFRFSIAEDFAPFSKAGEFTGDVGGNQLLSIAVFGYLTSNVWATDCAAAKPEFMYNLPVSRINTSSAWRYTGEYLWTDNSYHHFFAFAPSGAGTPSAKTAVGTPQLDFRVPEAIASHVDVLYGSNSNFNKFFQQGVTTPAAISFNFKHGLTKVMFAVKKGASYMAGGAEAVLSSVTIDDLWSGATLKFKTNGVDAVTGATWYRDDSEQLQRQFSITTPTGLIEHTLDNTMTTVSRLPLLMIPQKIAGRTDGKTPTVTLAFSMTDGSTLLQTFRLSDVTAAWLPGQSVTYNIEYNGNGVAPGTIKATVTDWNDQTVVGDIRGTYLYVSYLSVITHRGVNIFYSSDAPSITATCTGGVSMIKSASSPTAGFFSFPADVPVGDYTVTITTGNLSRNVAVKITDAPVEAIYVVSSDWANQAVGGDLYGTYLNVSQNSATVPRGKSLNIHYFTDARSVSASCTGGITLTQGAGFYTFPASAPVGDYTVTFTAGKLTRSVAIKVQ